MLETKQAFNTLRSRQIPEFKVFGFKELTIYENSRYTSIIALTLSPCKSFLKKNYFFSSNATLPKKRRFSCIYYGRIEAHYKKGECFVRKLMIVAVLLLAGCYSSTSEREVLENVWQQTEENTPNFEEIERLLVKVELEIGLGNLGEASVLFDELRELVGRYKMTPAQEARYYTFAILLLEMQANVVEVRIFSGSDAVALVMNVYENLPEGYRLVYHEIPSFVASDGLGYYVFLVSDLEDVCSAIRTFFVTDRGRILTLE